MSLIGYNLSQYPLENHYRVCRQYMDRSMDWNKISDSIREKGTIGVDVSDAISFFSHLELDSGYRLVCYMTSEYHGIFGRVAALKKTDDWQPKCDTHQKFHPHHFGNKLKLPECAVPPMEAIYNDGTAEGYFEAVLCSLFLDAIPYTCFQQNRWNMIERSLPENYDDAWDSRVALADWNPRYSGHTLTALSRMIENGIGASDGKDRIYLTQFNFCTSVNDHLLWTVLRTQRPIDSNHITDSNRYGETRKCCVFTQSSVLVAVQKE